WLQHCRVPVTPAGRWRGEPGCPWAIIPAEPGRTRRNMAARDPIVIVPYDPAWPELFRAQAAGLRAALGDVARRIDHIGSTSVPGLAAKPIVDVQISIVDFEPLDAYRRPLEALGYVFRVDNPER